MSEFELRYDVRGTRLCAIGSVELTHTSIFRPPLSLGSWPLHYDAAGDRLRQIGPYRIDYDMLGNRPRTLGGWRLDYDMLGQRLRQVGPIAIGYDRLGSRVHTIGPMTLRYGWHRQGTRPSWVDLGGPEMSQLPTSGVLALYIVLWRPTWKYR